MTTPLNILLVEDSADDADLHIAELRRAGFDPKWRRVQTEPDFLAELKKSPDIILSDYSMPQFNGLRAAELLRQSGMDIPFILISGTVGEDVAVEAMKHGATDYLLKDRIARLGQAVERALREIQERAERKRLETQFIEAQKMEVVGHLASGVAHDFNNILGVIIGYSDLMMPELAAESLSHKCADEIRQAAERAVALTRQLLLFSRKQKVQATVLDLNGVIEGMDKMLRRLIDENVELTIIPGKEIMRIKADSGLVGQLLMNLAVNARDALPNGGKLIIETSSITLDENYTRAHAGMIPGNYVMLAVTDTGIGMTDEVKAHLFEAFFTTKPKGKGTGLGLATCQTIVKQCGGCIEVQSELGKGTTFKIYFPQVEQPVDPVDMFKKSAIVKPLVGGTETLLLVEDEPSVRHLACSILEAQGYNVLSANNGKEGLRVARECKGGPISLVITDVIMPVMSGKVMAEWLKAFFPGIKILFTSGYTDDAIVQHGVLEPGVAFLPKPYTPAALAGKVREILNEKHGGKIQL
jgi:two-component system, cell cycle sensor histidine kinase and response regulator CckA